MPRLVALLLAAAATTASAESDENNFTAASADVTHYQRSLAARGAGDVRRGIALPLLVSRVQRVVADASHGEQEALAKNLKTRTIPLSRPSCGRSRVPAACRGTSSA